MEVMPPLLCISQAWGSTSGPLADGEVPFSRLRLAAVACGSLVACTGESTVLQAAVATRWRPGSAEGLQGVRRVVLVRQGAVRVCSLSLLPSCILGAG